jgi:hypothetical protein
MHPYHLALPAALAASTVLLAPHPQPLAQGAGAAALARAERLGAAELAQLPPGLDACALTADLARHATLRELQADLALALASCVNEESATLPKLLECVEEALDELAEGLAELAEVHAARLDLCALTGGGIYDPDLDEDELEAEIDHPLLPYAPGSEWVYHKTTERGLEVVTVTVTGDVKTVDDVECVVVRDVVTLDGELVEDTFDWFSQHEDGTVWYLGELSQEFEDGELVSLEGSWQAGEDGGLPGIVMPARPALGMTYRQELLLTVAEDAATVTSLDAKVRVPFGTFQGCLETSDFTPLEPEVLERKYYAPGIGLVLEVDAETGERTELVAFTPGP